MPSSRSEARRRAALLALISVSAWACATASYDNAPPDSLLAQTENGGSSDAAGGADSTGGSGKPSGTAGGAVAGSAQSGGSSSSGSAGKAGSNTGGMGSGGAGSNAGKGGSSSAGASTGGASSAGKGGSSSAGKGGSSGAGSGAGPSSAGSSSAGNGGAANCDAAHAVATLTTNQSYTGKASDCVRLVVEPSWSVINVQVQPLPSTQGYPVPFSFFNCGGNGTGSLTADYSNVTLKSGANPGCDFFVQFGGGETTIKVTYYD